MKPKVTNNTRLIRNKYLSEKEAKLAKFCEDNGIQFAKHNDRSGRGKNEYSFEFQPSYLDETEAKVCQYLEMKGIGYKFAVDEKGTHHYEFNEMIETDYAFPENASSIIRQEMPKLRKNYQKDFSFLDEEEDTKYIKDEIDKLNDEITALEKKGDLKRWWQKAWYYVWSPYRNKVKNRVKKKIDDLQYKINEKERNIERIKAEKQLLREMLVLAEVDLDDKPQDAKRMLKQLEKEEAVVLKDAKEMLKRLGEEAADW